MSKRVARITPFILLLAEQYHAQGEGNVTDFLPERFAIPTYFVIDGSGLIRGVLHGEDRKSLRKLESTVEDCLEELPSR